MYTYGYKQAIQIAFTSKPFWKQKCGVYRYVCGGGCGTITGLHKIYPSLCWLGNRFQFHNSQE